MADEPWKPERVVPPALARRLVARYRPELRDAPLEELAAGWDNTVYRIADEWIVRFPRRQIAAELIVRECEHLPGLAEKLPLPIPRPDFCGQPDEEFPWPYAGYRMLVGTTACRFDPDDDTRVRAAPVLAEFLLALHELDPARYAGLPADPLQKLDPVRYRPQLQEILGELERRGVAPAPAALLPIVDAAPRTSPEPTAVTHGDLYSRHLILDGGGALRGVIDWGDLQRNDPALDLSVVYAFLPAVGRQVFEEVYGTVGEETRARARLRALVSSTLGANFALSTGDRDLLRESAASLGRLAGTGRA